MASWNYVASIHKPTGVLSSTCCNLINSSTRTLVIGKNNRIEVHSIRENGVYLEQDIPVFGSVKYLNFLNDYRTGQDLLIMITNPHRISLLAYTPESIITLDFRDFQTPLESRIGWGPKYAKDPYNRCVCLILQKGYVDIVPISSTKGAFKNPFKARIEDCEARAVCMLKSTATPLMAIHYFYNGQSFVKVYEIVLGAFKEVNETEWNFNTDDSLCKGLIPLNDSSLCILTQHTLLIHSRGTGSFTLIQEAEIGEIQAVTEVSDNKYVLGNMKGDFMFLYFNEGNVVIQRLGEVSIPYSISYLDNNYFFIGSAYGDSQIIKVLTEKINSSFISIEKIYDNIGPITDFKVLHFDSSNQRGVLACSGYKQHGSLKYFRKGISLNIEAESEVGKCNGLWSLKDSYNEANHSLLLLSFLNETKLFRMQGETLLEFYLPGIASNSSTIYAANTPAGILQVTNTEIRLIRSKHSTSLILSADILPNSRISLASSYNNTCAIVLNGIHLYTLSLQNDSIFISNTLQVSNEIACLSLSKDIIMIGLWIERAIKILNVYNLAELWVDVLEEEMLPRSVLLSNMDGVRYLFVGLGDGHLVIYTLPDFEKKTLAIGSNNVFLNEFECEGKNHVFIGCDSPSVVYSTHQILQLASVSLSKVTAMTHFVSESFPRCLSFICDDKLVMTSIEDIQKLGIKTVPLKMTVRKICFLEDYLVILSARHRKHCILLLSKFDQRKLSRVDLPENEKGTTLGIWNELVILGSTDPEANNEKDVVGYLRIYKVIQDSLVFMNTLEVEGIPLCIKVMDGYLVSGVKNWMIIWKRDEGAGLLEVTRTTRFTYVACCDTYENYIAVSDLVKSVAILKLVNEELKYVCKNFNTMFILDICLVNADTLIAADQYNNLLLMQNQGNMRLEITKAFFLADQVNCLRRSAINHIQANDFTDNLDRVLYATVNGALGIIAALPNEIYNVLLALQSVLGGRHIGVGGITIQQYRTHKLPVKHCQNLEWLGFIDGDFVEMYLELKPFEQDTVAMLVSERSGQELTHQDIQKLLICLSKIH